MMCFYRVCALSGLALAAPGCSLLFAEGGQTARDDAGIGGDAGIEADECLPKIIINEDFTTNPNDWSDSPGASYDADGATIDRPAMLTYMGGMIDIRASELFLDLETAEADLAELMVGDDLGFGSMADDLGLRADPASISLPGRPPVRLRLREVEGTLYIAGGPLFDSTASAPVGSLELDGPLGFHVEDGQIESANVVLGAVRFSKPPLVDGWCEVDKIDANFGAGKPQTFAVLVDGTANDELGSNSLILSAPTGAVLVQSLARYNFMEPGTTVELHASDITLEDGATLRFELSQSGVETIGFELQGTGSDPNLTFFDKSGSPGGGQTVMSGVLHLRFRAESEVFLETSSDGTTWDDRHQVAAPAGRQALEIAVRLTAGPGGEATRATLDTLRGGQL